MSFLEVAQPEAFPPIRQKKTNGWGTEPMQIHPVRDLAGCGKTRPELDFEGSVTGHDFSRADKANQIDVGL
jgi:hypothetical protein